MQLKLKPLNNRADSIWKFICVLLCAAIFCGVSFYSGDVSAAAGNDNANKRFYNKIDAPTIQPAPDTYYTGDLFCPYNYDGLSGRVVHCIEAIVIQAAKKFLNTFLPYYEAIIISTMVLAVTIYGVLITIGSVSRPTGQTFFFLFKLAGVAFFTLQFGKMIDSVFDIMHGLLEIVTNYTTVSNLSACSDTSYLAEFYTLKRDNLTAWDKVDCLFITLLGISMTQTTLVASTVVTSFGFVALLTASVFTGGIGLIIVIIAIFYMLTLLFSVVRAIKIYLVSVITISFLICVSPIIIPMLLFSPTRPLFDKWLKNLANYMLVPVFLFAFLSMIVAAYDAILFKGPSSLYYAVANEASQLKGFNFKDWLEYGTSGKVVRDAKGVAKFDGDEPVTEGGTFVGKDVPGLDAIGIMSTIDACEKATDIERQALGESCEKIEELQVMLDCAINPIVAHEGKVTRIEEGESCKDLEGRPYYGFLRNEQIFNFAIAPNIETDMDARKSEDKGCGWNLLCHASDISNKVAGVAWDVIKQVGGAIFRFRGWIAQGIGKAYQAIGSFIKDKCPSTGSIPGMICNGVGSVYQVAGSVVHTVGTLENFGGRVMMNGLAEELGKIFDIWFDVETIDFQKIASYRCKMQERLTNPKDPAYLKCPGPEAIIMDIIYILCAACVVAYLMLRWLNYIPSLGNKLVGGARIESSLPGEGKALQATSNIQHRMEQLISKRKRGG